MTIEVAKTPFKRMKGLLGRTTLPDGHGLLILPCNAVHTLGMRFAIDLYFFDKTGNLVRTYRQVPPGKWWRGGGLRAYAVLETRAGDPTFDNADVFTQIKKDHFYV
jgi:uncharacterized membrane protein (UPF0127 family)